MENVTREKIQKIQSIKDRLPAEIVREVETTFESFSDSKISIYHKICIWIDISIAYNKGRSDASAEALQIVKGGK